MAKTNTGQTKARARRTKSGNGATLGFEQVLWQAADKLRGHMDASEYKHVVLGLIFLKYISDAFDAHRAKLEATPGADPDHSDEYRADNIFWVPAEARWEFLRGKAKQPEIGTLVDDAMVAIERENPSLKGVLPKDYGRPTLDKQRLGELIDLISGIGFHEQDNRSRDILGRVYEYFLGQFASREGKKGGEFYTPRSVVRLLVEMIEPYQGRVYDPCCGSSGMFVQSEEFIRAHGGRLDAIAIYGQESNPTTWRLAKMNLAIRGIDANLGPHNADSFHQDLHPDLKADFVLANPPFNDSDWGGDRLRQDVRWKYGVPHVGNANFAWVQQFIHHLAPTGIAGFVLANGSMASHQAGEGDIRKNIVEADLVDCMIALGPQLFYGTQIPACLWFITKDKGGRPTRGGQPLRQRNDQTLFIDARRMSVLVDRTHRELTDDEVARISRTYHAWRGENDVGEYEDIPGYCKSTTIDEIRDHGHVLTPGRYVGAPDAAESDDEPFEVKMKRLVAQLEVHLAESHRLEDAIRENLRPLGYRD
jgi:type I restriction enzyme M protein